uniref:NADH-ubiquinone oxidoreductase chain 3 n=1 Tax=Tenebrio molitor TaxID=7067 RepID=A0A075CCC7_TENMO|nr:NADH dehydrogenase subunit 3 [Tenebrio molitor]AGX28415.1 NADH dehydrogenase subunit 3 [Tenebrio molitor]QDG00993.1 NADH dehydrogenase subunit 3 [Tenebrio molitor]QDG01006.1 NADH dehydrogenase subunit 3 [Tenebrio molitor]QDG01019.1 NADH dehydrogenase subunit 3 [Tenebrio molitor]QDG01032.1 NADH dehydrogenase subunit 3 [Tenebrio molitor]
MIILTMLSTIIMAIAMVLITVLNITSKKSFADREKNSPFECGFDPKSTARLPFSMHFFLIAIIFLIFDVEITLLFPLMISMKFNSMMMYFSTTMIFVIVLLVGLIHEWNQGALDWTN